MYVLESCWWGMAVCIYLLLSPLALCTNKKEHMPIAIPSSKHHKGKALYTRGRFGRTARTLARGSVLERV